ncbi:potassium channel family protein [Bacillus massilinigeriensis]|uniref:potassium channel family protein n=1 Tax=Bacillus mediterraneensis TaxID=1805474 RepID=UPI0008F950B8|nr:potassium channel protein [Bacillus mediterraneensis]
MPQQLYVRFIRMPLLFRILLIAGLNMVIFGLIIHALEPDTFPTLFEGIWWAIITASTVGYGDYAPTSLSGRVATIVLLFAGAGFLSSYFVTLSTTAVNKQEDYYKGKTTFKGKNHLVIVGWNERSKKIAEVFAVRKENIVLIDETLNTHPVSSHSFHFIKGAAHLDETLIRAGVPSASLVIITADQNLVEHQADKNTVLTLLAIKGLQPSVRCIAEVLTSNQVNNAFRAGADEIIETNVVAGSMILSSINGAEGNASLQKLMTGFRNKEIKLTPPSLYLGNPSTYGSQQTIINAEGRLLIGLKKGDDYIVNPPADTMITRMDELIILK